MTLRYLANFIKNVARPGRFKIEKTNINIEIFHFECPEKTTAFITNPMNPDGFYMDGEGNVDPVGTSEIFWKYMSSLTEKEQDLWMMRVLTQEKV